MGASVAAACSLLPGEGISAAATAAQENVGRGTVRLDGIDGDYEVYGGPLNTGRVPIVLLHGGAMTLETAYTPELLARFVRHQPVIPKAQDLVRQQYAAVGSAGAASLTSAIDILAQAATRHPHEWHMTTLARLASVDAELYSLAHNLTRLRQRGLSGKRSLALREFGLGIESLTRFVAGQPLRTVHECVFGILALESEPVDPRL